MTSSAQENYPAAGLSPTHTYIPNCGYERKPEEEYTLSSTQNKPASNSEAQDVTLDDTEDSDAYYTSEDDVSENELSTANPNDYTKSYNRQRRLNDASAPDSERPKTNPQKPTANTRASVDDQIKSLSRHAAKLKLDDAQAGLSGGGENTKDKSDRATSERVLDPRTRMILLKMINKGVVSEINGCISTGKEANVYHALLIPEAEEGGEMGPRHMAIKVYKTAALSFKDRERYVTGEFRFKKGYKKDSRSMVRVWAEKEMRNLNRLFAAGIPCPEPVYLRVNVLAMGFLGDKRGWPAPRLRDVSFESEDADVKWKKLYIQLLSYMRVLYQTCKLVHGDLSEYNVLYHEEKLWIIDVSQSVEHEHPRSLEFLRTDIKNVSDFFRNQGVDTLAERTVFGFITESEGSVEEEGMRASVETLYAKRAETGNYEQAIADELVDNEVWRQQFIPQTLNQVYDMERDGDKLQEEAGGVDLVYKDLLANNGKPAAADSSAAGATASEEGSDEDEDSEEREWSDRDNKKPRGKKHQEHDEKKAHKEKVKEEKREKRKTKMPKHEKKRLIKTSGNKKK
ncbi:Serine/threonine-protein kinase Rio1 [Patellaria atrata CBS 101060]|uniref:Serine/threonine-protein kinase RIO1 n=1 Tax=Patellaria atrata CBS 101060 TaxID=1346257 RepID=A0A9P4SJ84_9PEZI|nr:Serine/threonine-protein kinase Rio1 [Patellaria atrata CBS 101060]